MFISKNKNDYPSLKVRKKILDRFTGFFGTFERKQQEEAINRDNHYVYEFAKESPEGVKAILRGQAFSNLKVSAKENKISMYTGAHSMQHGTSLVPVSIPEGLLEFTVRFSADYKTIYLQHGEVTLNCDNKHYLKLVCNGPGIEFSVSKIEKEQVNVRFTRLTKANGQELVSGYFTKLYQGKELK